MASILIGLTMITSLLRGEKVIREVLKYQSNNTKQIDKVSTIGGKDEKKRTNQKRKKKPAKKKISNIKNKTKKK